MLGDMEQDVIIVDAPWGGKNYKDNATMRLYMSGKEIHELYLNNKHSAKLFIFKIPCNYEVEFFKHQVGVHVDIKDYIKKDWNTGKDRCYYKFLCIHNNS